ncbi:MAG TPA: thioredoxin domain-containing protein [Allosphingosinicella sp.]|nr:thioredoxin domain-containing protein [Allosphingosinicella sp.]
MRRARWAAAVALSVAAAVALSAASAAGPAARRAATADWTRIVVATPEGGYRMGNPNAALKLIEYGSLTCPHCAHFEAEGVPPLVQKYVRSGRVSYEFRNYVRDPYDLVGALLSRCAGPRGYFPLTHRIFAAQAQWTARFGALSASQYDALDALSGPPKLIRIAAVSGLDAMAAQHGVTPSRARACLSDTKAVDRLTEMRQAANSRYDLQGTPTFVINGKKAENASGWAALEPLLARPGG